MRYLIYTLIAANLAFFAWYALVSPPAQPAAPGLAPVQPGVAALVLLSERGEDVVVEATEPQAVAVDSEAPLPLAIDNPPAPSENDVVPAPQLPVCRTVGPFLERQDAKTVYAKLAAQGYAVKVRDGDVREPAGYWVYLPARSAQEARRIVADLDAHGMKDYFVGKQNHISLGIFSDRNKAQAHQLNVQKLGYDAVLDERYRLRDVYWLDIEERGQSLLASPVWGEMQARHVDIRVQRVSCE